MKKQHFAILLEEGFFDTILSILKRIWDWITKSINNFLEWLAPFFTLKGLKERFILKKEKIEIWDRKKKKILEVLSKEKMSFEEEYFSGQIIPRISRCINFSGKAEDLLNKVTFAVMSSINAVKMNKEEREDPMKIFLKEMTGNSNAKPLKLDHWFLSQISEKEIPENVQIYQGIINYLKTGDPLKESKIIEKEMGFEGYDGVINAYLYFGGSRFSSVIDDAKVLIKKAKDKASGVNETAKVMMNFFKHEGKKRRQDIDLVHLSQKVMTIVSEGTAQIVSTIIKFLGVVIKVDAETKATLLKISEKFDMAEGV